ncbi:MAG TPA: hypothetical protein VLM36_00670 [Sphingomicrobium sp.]|nr:hypothetical protein [Sphingomicrobium sp.]
MNERVPPPEWPINPGPDAAEPAPPAARAAVTHGKRTRRSSPGWATLVLVGGLIIVALLVAYLMTSRNPEQDKLTMNELARGTAPAPDPAKLCASNATYDLIKRELFRRAAQVRGSDQDTFDRLSNYAVIRMENPVMESEDNSTAAINCSGSLSLDLPPGVAVVGGRHTLTADVDYTIERAADGSGNVVLLRNSEAVVTPLATLARINQPQAEARTAPLEPAAPAEPQQQNVAAPAPANEVAAPKTSPVAAPGFDCSTARSKGEEAVCTDSGLAALDRNMTTQFRQAIAAATGDQRQLLRRTGERFIAYRDRCPSRSCMADAYVGRMREIRDIMEGRWQPPR